MVAYDETYNIKRKGTYQEVESWAEEQMKSNEWDCFGIKEYGIVDRWAEEAA